MEQKRIEDYIKVYDDIIPGNLCDELIVKYQQSDPEFVDNEGRPKFHHLTLEPDISKSLLEIVRLSLVKYANTTGLTSWMPEKYAVEDFRIKRYRMGTDDRFSPHVDVGDYASARRFLAFFMYLNTVKEGGETNFVTINKKVKPKKGRLLIFPPLWTFPHEGRPTISEDKYIVGSYLHYI
jgi:hypothetical protein